MGFSRYAIARSAAAMLCIVMLVTVLGCEASPELLTNSEQDSLTKLRSGKFSLISNDDLSALKHDAETGKSVGRYQVHREGFRTWRLDTTTGQTCLLLTSQEDWKKPETELQSCGSN